MYNIRMFQRLGRLVSNPNVQLQTRRTLYPHYIKYMAVNVGPKSIGIVEKTIVYLGFLFGILGPATYIMYDVGKKRPDNKR
ncbi:hypothetical protein HUG17_6347 [Dermatophagoides farinae]|nr:hypothetical protein HUG17_6347 [Dermatophagoides farinae]